MHKMKVCFYSVIPTNERLINSMIYLDYAANTPVSQEILDNFVKCEKENLFNPNSNNPLAANTRNKLISATERIAKRIGVKKNEIIFTSSATESNNLAIKGIVKQYKNRGKHIITTYLEHSSVNGAIGYLVEEGFEVEFVDLTKDGLVDLEHLKELLRKDTILVSICHVDSEIGLIQPIDVISDIVKKRSNSFFHVDGTQALGKIKVNLDKVDSYSFASHKFYGLNGCGGLVLKEGIIVEPLFHGGLSVSPFRSGTPALALIDAMALSLDIAVDTLEESYDHVDKLNEKLKKGLIAYKNVYINSNKNSIPHILNISLETLNSEIFKEKLAVEEICVSTKSACCAINTPSRPVFALTKNKKLALSTLRISISHLTTSEEIEIFLEKFDYIYKELNKKE